ncbi:beta-N-acetylhexosaminidase [Nocardia panacis]|uniref:beta-N-acetylhexosaminidase n=1 Tax=Nocardia panacis TaxID=2340916 RepID=UPI001EF04F7C|nr:beta-N-acetylhexosaminidase [Nocardia panacis]
MASGVALGDVLPIPAQVHPDSNADYTLSEDDSIAADPGAELPAGLLADLLRTPTGFRLPVVPAQGSIASGIALTLNKNADSALGEQGYRMTVGKGITIAANGAAGLFNGVATLRQLFGHEIETDTREPGPWKVAGGTIVDYPRFAYRGAMLDVSRRFRPKTEVLRYLDDLARYKMNYLQLHLTDDQGWRLRIDKWPLLTDIGSKYEVGGGPGGYYTKADYAEIIAYAAGRGITIIPEIDGPGHTNAAQSVYPELNCDGKAVPARNDISVGYSSFCVHSEATYAFLDDVIAEVAAMTPGPYIHIGGDEARATTPQDYRTYVDRVLPIVTKYHKIPIGWHEITKSDKLSAPTIAQYWGTTGDPSGTGDAAQEAARMIEAAKKGVPVILSPANRSYLDMKYTPQTKRGLMWAAYIEIDAAYDWDPGTYLKGVDEKAILGVAAPQFSESMTSLTDVRYMAFPRLTATAELGWSPAATHDWEGFKRRLAEHARFWETGGIPYYRSPKVDWPARAVPQFR